jgi:Tol biopolymer transport system component
MIAYSVTAEYTKVLERTGKVVNTLNARFKPMQWLTFSFPNNLIVVDTENPRNVVLVMPPKYDRGITFTLPRGPIRAARFSPNMTQLAYELEDRIWVAKVDTVKFSVSASRQLTRKSSSNPAWSPDGRWIVYLADNPNRDCLDCLHVMSATGGEEFMLVDGAGRPVSALRNAHIFWHRN